MIAPAIKRLTAGIHVDAESAVRACDPFASIDRYTSYLVCLLGLYDAIEPLLLEWLDGVVADAPMRFTKARAIEADLRHLGVEGVRVAAARYARGPRMTSVAAALGVAYVLEGKTLGARFLVAEAREALSLDVDRGATFLSGYGARTGPMWNRYRAALEGWVATNGRRGAVLEGARATFASFIACVSSPRVATTSLPHRAAS